MKKLFSVLKYTKDYKGYTFLNILFNVLFAVFGAFSLLLIAPLSDVLFTDQAAKAMDVVRQGPPEFKLSPTLLANVTSYYLALLIVQKGKIMTLVLICICYFILTLLKNAFRYLAMFYIAPIRNGVVRDLRNRMHKKSLELPLSYYSEEKKGDLMSRMTTDVQEIEWSIMQTLEMVFREPLTILMLFGTMVVISAKLTLYIILLLPIAAIIIVVLGKSLKNASRKTKETLGQIISVIEETLGSLKVIKAFSAEKPTQKKFEDLNQTFFKQSVKVYRKTDLSSPLTEVIVTGILMYILFLGGKMVFANDLKGSLFMTYFALASQLIPPIKQLTTSYSNIQKGIASEERINKILHADNLIVERAGAKTLEPFKKEIEYRHLSFAYHKGDDGYVLRDINLKIPKGKTIALVGQSGSGKTTLADMLPRFYDSDKGELLVDGTNVKDVTIRSLRNLIGVVTQESVLFNDTVANNIAFGISEASPQQIEEAAKIANAHGFITAMPQGYQTTIGDRGGKLSGGQRQRLSIARAVLKDPEILILDEATSALDTESEKLVQEALSNLMKNRTSLVIAHRLSTIANADEIIVMNNGEIIERGNHAQLLALNGTYKKLCDMQSFK